MDGLKVVISNKFYVFGVVGNFDVKFFVEDRVMFKFGGKCVNGSFIVRGGGWVRWVFISDVDIWKFYCFDYGMYIVGVGVDSKYGVFKIREVSFYF